MGSDRIAVVEGLHYAYPTYPGQPEEGWALRGVDLEVRRGEFLALMGPVGAGKTTLCLSLNGLVPQQTGGRIRGRVLVEGKDTRRTPVAEFSPLVGLVFQDPDAQLFNATVEDEIAFGIESLGLPRDEMAERLEWALKVAGLEDLRRRSPSHLSGGQKQRLAIASVLAMRPPLLVLDEPASALDPGGRVELAKTLQWLRDHSSATIILAEHDPDLVARFADRLVVLVEGHVRLDGSPRDLFLKADEMEAVGLAVPELCELAAVFIQHEGAGYRFVSQEEAAQALSSRLSDGKAATVSSAGRCQATLWRSLPRSAGHRLPALLAEGSTSQSANVHTVSRSAAELQDVWFSYEGQEPALRGVSLCLPAQACIALIGHNGSGKTTLAKHLNGLLRPSRGKVLLEGRDIAGVSVGQLSRTVGYVFQNPDYQLFAPTVWEELAFGLRNQGLPATEVKRRVEEALASFDLAGLAAAPPAVLGYSLRKRVALASVCAMRPRLLVLDEPSVGLDWRSTRQLMALVEGLRQEGATVVLITHDLRLVSRYADHLAVLEQGRLLKAGPTREVLSQFVELGEAFPSPPPLPALAAALSPEGALGVPLTAEEFYAAFARLEGREA